MGHSKNHGRRGLTLPLQLSEDTRDRYGCCCPTPMSAASSLTLRDRLGSEDSACGTAAKESARKNRLGGASC